MKLRKVLKISAITLAFIMVFAGCSKKEETKEDKKTEETTTETTAEEDDEESDLGFIDEDDEFEDYASDCYSISADDLPDQNIEINEEYYKFYDYSKLDSTEMPEHKEVKPDDFENEGLKKLVQEYQDKGYELTSAEENAQYFSGTGIMDEESGWGVAYLYNGFTGYGEDGDTYYNVEAYLVPQEDIESVLGLKLVSEDDTTAEYKDGGKGYCPKEGKYTYDKENELLVYEESFTYSAEAVG